MITEDLISYIQSQRRKNIGDIEIRSRLERAGCYREDIAEAFQKLTTPTVEVKPVTQPQPQTTPITLVSSPVAVAPTVEIEKKEEPPVVTAIETEPVTLSVAMPEITEPAHSYSPIIPLTRRETPIASVNLPTQPERAPQPTEYIIPESIEEKSIVQPAVQVASVAPIKAMPVSLFSAQSSSQVKPLFDSTEELVPSLIPKSPQPPLSQPVSPLSVSQPTPVVSTPPEVPLSQNVKVSLPESAVLSTFSRDSISSRMEGSESTHSVSLGNHKKTIIRIVTIICIALGVVGVVFLFKLGYIPTPPFSFVKKDPKVALLNMGTTLDGYESYTSTIHTTLSSPSFANITNGLVTGSRVTSTNTDSVTIDAKGSIHNTRTADSAALSQYTLAIGSSLLQKSITSNVTYGNNTLLVGIPDLKELLGVAAPQEGTVAIEGTEYSVLLSMVPSNIGDMLQKADVYHILSKGVPPYVKNNTVASIKELVTSARVTDKGTEIINGEPTYHYEFTFERPAVKKFLSSILNTFTVTLSDENKKHIDEAFGATTVDSFDVWVGKGDGVIRQYGFTLTTPLSKVLNLDDKGIAGNTVQLSWVMTYADFNKAPVVVVPDTVLPAVDFTKSKTDQDIKTALSLFRPLALSLKNAEGSYGTRANPTGSCTNPNPRSLFSPVGHTKGATTAVGSIASSMNTLLGLTNGAGSCFSTPTAWALSFPLLSDVTSSYCVDSVGVSTTLTTPLKGTSCK